MKYHSAPLIPHKSALMSAPANLLAEEVCLPAALLKKSALENNISWMQRYADARGVSLAPHGKTTMTPWIFQAQQRAGAWGIGVGSAWQASAAMASGIQRILMVNQLVGKANMQVVAQLKAHYRAVDFICCVDSEVNVRTLSAFFADQGQTLDVLIELGVPARRCPRRSPTPPLAAAPEISMASLSFYHAAPAIRRGRRRSAASMKYYFPAPTFLAARRVDRPLPPAD